LSKLLSCRLHAAVALIVNTLAVACTIHCACMAVGIAAVAAVFAEHEHMSSVHGAAIWMHNSMP